MDTVRIALIGSGYMGRSYAECLKHYTTAGKLTAVFGGSRAQQLAKDFGIDSVDTLPALFARKGVDAILVASPHSLHLLHVVEAARAGKHVLVEKPMALNTAECDSMIRACSEARVNLSVIQTCRFRGTIARAKKVIDEGRIGEVRMICLNTLFPREAESAKGWLKSAAEGGFLLDQGAHNFDFLRWFAGSEAVRVFARVRQFQDGPYPAPTAMAQIDFQNGVVANTWMSSELPEPGIENSSFRAHVIGSKGMLDIDGYGKLLVTLDGKPWSLYWEQPTIDFVKRPLARVRLEAFYTQVQDFIDSVRERRPPAVKGEDGRSAVELIDACRRSSDTGQAVKLPL
jgi:UDP-N-acetyl-2-amino-2-deoxyglucuronate dehydrogenase